MAQEGHLLLLPGLNQSDLRKKALVYNLQRTNSKECINTCLGTHHTRYKLLHEP